MTHALGNARHADLRLLRVVLIHLELARRIGGRPSSMKGEGCTGQIDAICGGSVVCNDS